jgi:hypothetical protein
MPQTASRIAAIERRTKRHRERERERERESFERGVW